MSIRPLPMKQSKIVMVSSLCSILAIRILDCTIIYNAKFWPFNRRNHNDKHVERRVFQTSPYHRHYQSASLAYHIISYHIISYHIISYHMLYVTWSSIRHPAIHSHPVILPWPRRCRHAEWPWAEVAGNSVDGPTWGFNRPFVAVWITSIWRVEIVISIYFA